MSLILIIIYVCACVNLSQSHPLDCRNKKLMDGYKIINKNGLLCWSTCSSIIDHMVNNKLKDIDIQQKKSIRNQDFWVGIASKWADFLCILLQFAGFSRFVKCSGGILQQYTNTLNKYTNREKNEFFLIFLFWG